MQRLVRAVSTQRAQGTASELTETAACRVAWLLE